MVASLLLPNIDLLASETLVTSVAILTREQDRQPNSLELRMPRQRVFPPRFIESVSVRTHAELF